MDLGVRLAGAKVRAAADDDPCVVDDERTDHGVGTCTSAPAFGQRERTSHMRYVSRHARIRRRLAEAIRDEVSPLLFEQRVHVLVR
jgi:hypothetical protein